jgi:hypothetical protein
VLYPDGAAQVESDEGGLPAAYGRTAPTYASAYRVSKRLEILTTSPV